MVSRRIIKFPHPITSKSSWKYMEYETKKPISRECFLYNVSYFHVYLIIKCSKKKNDILFTVLDFENGAKFFINPTFQSIRLHKYAFLELSSSYVVSSKPQITSQ